MELTLILTLVSLVFLLIGVNDISCCGLYYYWLTKLWIYNDLFFILYTVNFSPSVQQICIFYIDWTS